MDTSRFDSLARAVTSPETRRRLFALPLGLLIANGLEITLEDEATAGRRRRRKARRSRRKRDRKCKPRAVSAICAGKCGSIKNRKSCGRKVNCGPCGDDLACPECAANEVCRNGACLPCTVTCTSDQTPTECGAALGTALSDTSLSTIIICPGTYAGNFIIDRGVTVIGAGQGADPASNSVLSGNQAGRVIWLKEDAATVTLEKLRIIGGQLTNDAGVGILSQGAGLTMRNCTVSGNQGSNVSGVGIYSLSSLQMSGCEVSNNACTSGDEALAGGIYAQGAATLTDCLITANATSGDAGGLLVASALTSLAGQTTVSNNTAAGAGGILVASGASLTIAPGCRVIHNTAAELYGGIANEGTVTLQGSSPATIVINNCPDNCLNVPGCTNVQIDCSN